MRISRGENRNAGLPGRATVVLAMLCLVVVMTPAQSVRLAQIDASRLLTQQLVDLYVAVTDQQGNGVEGLLGADFQVYESTDGENYEPAPITGFDSEPHSSGGVTFLLLIDNSGSMYDTLEGEETENPREQRVTVAKNAIRSFLDSIDNPLDRVGLAAFNTNYTPLLEPTRSPAAVTQALEELQKPDRDNAFTELYRAIEMAADELSAVEGRKVLVVLSDGENYPFSVHRDAPHPTYEEEVVEADSALRALQEAGIGAYAVNFATSGDPELVDIVSESGGLLYDAGDEEELAGVYEDIRRRVLEEYRLTYRPSLAPGERRYVRVEVSLPAAGGDSVRTSRVYITSTIFGLPADNFGWSYLIPFLAALLFAAGVGLLRFKNNRSDPNLEVLDPRGRGTQLFSLSGERTVIGASSSADLTVAGSADMREQHATILFDEKKGSYTVVSEAPIKVNNQKTTKRQLTAGDIVQLPGATIVFDNPKEEKEEKDEK